MVFVFCDLLEWSPVTDYPSDMSHNLKRDVFFNYNSNNGSGALFQEIMEEKKRQGFFYNVTFMS